MPELDDYLPGLRPPLEAQLIDLADEIAYNTADLDDAFSAGLLTAEDVADARAAVSRDPRGRGDPVPRRHRARALPRSAAAADRRSGFRPDRRHRRRAPARRCARCRRGARVTRRAWRRSPPEAAETSRALKRFLYARVYASAALGEDRRRSMAMIGELFRFFLASPDRLPEPYCAAGARRARAPRGLRLHRRHDRRLLPPHLRADAGTGRLLFRLVKLESSASRTP